MSSSGIRMVWARQTQQAHAYARCRERLPGKTRWARVSVIRLCERRACCGLGRVQNLRAQLRPRTSPHAFIETPWSLSSCSGRLLSASWPRTPVYDVTFAVEPQGIPLSTRPLAQSRSSTNAGAFIRLCTRIHVHMVPLFNMTIQTHALLVSAMDRILLVDSYDSFSYKCVRTAPQRSTITFTNMIGYQPRLSLHQGVP
jgi:hypothetical protein